MGEKPKIALDHRALGGSDRLESTNFENNKQNISSHLQLVNLENTRFFGYHLSK